MQLRMLNNGMEEQREYDPRRVGVRIFEARTAHQLSQSELASRCGFSVTALSNWENGRQRPSIAAAKKIVDLFDLTLDYLLLGRTATLRHSVAQHLEQTLRR